MARFVCAACGDDGLKQAVLRAEGSTLYLCGGCASHQAHPPPTLAPPDDWGRRLAVAVALDPEEAAGAAARMLAGRAGGVALDLGCGLGLAVDMVARRPGWAATGVDPGALAAWGAAALGARLAEGGPAEALRHGARADVVRCEGVLERSPDPLALLRAIPALATRDARWLIATADAAGLYEGEDAPTIHRLAAPPTRLLLSAPGLRTLLRRSLHPGLATTSVTCEAGHLRADSAPGAADAGALLDAYLAVRLAEPPADPLVADRLRLAALERALVRDDRAAALAHLGALAPALADSVAAADARSERFGLAALFAEAPPYAGRLLLRAGLALRHADPPRARTLLERAAGLCQRAFALAPGVMPDQPALAATARALLDGVPA